MEAARKRHVPYRDNKPARVPIRNLEGESATELQPDTAPVRPFRQLPTGPGTRSLRQAAVLQMQRTLGNRAVANQIRSGVQRQEETEGGGGGAGGSEPMPGGTSPTGAGPSEISSGSSFVTTSASGVNIEAPMVTVGSPILQTNGIVQASTIIADNVVASSYTPGAGNIW